VAAPTPEVLRPGGVEIYRADDTGGYDPSSDTGDIYKPEGGK
jgi:hypothetical protein